MTHVYSTHIYNSKGEDVTGSFSPEAIIINSQSSNENQSFLYSEKTVHISPDVNSFPLVKLDSSKKRGNVFGEPEDVWSVKRNDIYQKLKINGNKIVYKNGTIVYISPQDLVVDNDGNTYISFNCGSLGSVANNGGPAGLTISGFSTEYQNVTPIIKIDSSGNLVGCEYVLGVVHATHLCFWKDENGKDTLGFSIYSEGIGTRAETSLPSNWNDSWSNRFIPSSTSYVSFEGFKTEGLFTSFAGTDSSIFIPSNLYNGVGKQCIRFADEVDTFGANSHNINQSYIYDDEGKNILLGVSIDGKTKHNISYSKQSVFHFNPSIQDDNKYNIPNNLISNGSSKWGVRTLQSFYLRGAHKYLSYGSKNSGENGTALSIVNITQPSQSGQSIISQKDYTFDSTWEELEGIYIDKDETLLYVINLYEDSDGLKIHLHKHQITNLY